MLKRAVAFVLGLLVFVFASPSWADWTNNEASFVAACSSYVPSRYGVRLELRDDLPTQLAQLACVEDHDPPSSVPRELGFVQLHFQFDDRKFDHLRAAMITVSCFANGQCAHHRLKRRHGYDKVATGIVHYYAHNTDAAKLQEALARTGLPTALAEAFLQQFEAAQTEIASLVRDLDPRRQRLYVEIPRQVFEQRKQHFEDYASLYERYDRVAQKVAQGDYDQKLLSETLAIRRAYIRRCVKKGDLSTCLNGPLARPLTDLAAQLSVELKQSALGFAENDILANTAGAHTAAMQIYVKQNTAVRAEADAYAEYAELKGKNVPESALKRKFGGSIPLQISRGLAWQPPDQKVDYRGLLEGVEPEVDWASGVISGIAKQGKRVKVSFKTTIGKYHESDCVETDRIDRIDADGTIHYRKKCKHKKTHVIKNKTKPVYLDPGETAGLRKGQWIRVVVLAKDRVGYLVEGFSDERRDKLTSLRGL